MATKSVTTEARLVLTVRALAVMLAIADIMLIVVATLQTLRLAP